jgi:hypothetical protein
MMATKTIQKPNQPSHVKDLALLFAIPIGIAIFAALAVYAPRLFAHPKSDFMYWVCNNYGCTYDFGVDGSGYVYQFGTNHDQHNGTGTSTLRYYNAKDDSTRSLTLEEAKHYQLNTSSKSSDGYSLTREGGDSSWLFWGNPDSGWYLKNGAKKKKVELSTNASYSQDVRFLGWINK